MFVNERIRFVSKKVDYLLIKRNAYMIKNNYFTENSDLMLHFDKLIKFQEIVEQYEDGFSDAKKYAETNDDKYAMAPADFKAAIDYYREVLTSIGDLSGNYVAQHAAEMDKIGLKFQDGKVVFPEVMTELWKQFNDAGLVPYELKRGSGGLGLPVTVYTMVKEIISRADISFAMSIAVLNLAETIERFGSKELKDKWLPKMSTSQYTGAMALTEPNYGSDLSNVMLKATKKEDGTYILNGTKRFITHGCGMNEMPAVVLTLARTGTSTSGARGLSFFAVDGKYIQTAGIEHKLGIRCSPTCEIVYENTPAELIGEEGYGLTRYAMGMMNGARLSVGTLGVSIGSAVYEESKKYASEREQFGKTIENIPAVKKMLDRMEREVAAMRCLNYEAAFMMDMYLWRSERMEEAGMSEKEIRKDETLKNWEKLASLFTPINKYYTSEVSNKLAYDAIQIHGGVGYTEEFDVARLYRDARILSIYEGTSQLQVVAAIGGIISGMGEKGHLRSYHESSKKSFPVSKATEKIFSLLENAVNIYKDMDDKEYFAAEVVEIAGRLISGLLMERTVSLLEGEAKSKRQALCNDYNRDSISIARSCLVQLKSGKEKEPVLD